MFRQFQPARYWPDRLLHQSVAQRVCADIEFEQDWVGYVVGVRIDRNTGGEMKPAMMVTAPPQPVGEIRRFSNATSFAIARASPKPPQVLTPGCKCRRRARR